MKLLSNGPQRPQDQIDIVTLLRQANEDDLRRARQTASLIVERGFGRGRDLLALLAEQQRGLS